MQYKTIVLELLEQRPEKHNELCRQGNLLPKLERYAQELKSSHEAWQSKLSQAKPARDPSQLASEALELALAELEHRLDSESSPTEDTSFSLEETMSFLHRHTPPE